MSLSVIRGSYHCASLPESPSGALPRVPTLNPSSQVTLGHSDPLPSASLTAPGTGAGEHHVFLVVTIVLPPRARGAVAQGGLTPLTAHVVQPDGPGPRAVVGFAYSGPDLSTAQLPAGDCGVPEVPAVVTDRPPPSSMPHLQPASTLVGPIGQTDPEGTWGVGAGKSSG